MEPFKYNVLPGRYRHFKGNEYEVLGMARHSETEEEMVIYRTLYGERGLWVRPAAMWCETVERDGKEREPHSDAVGYTDYGKDATVSDNRIDFTCPYCCL